MLYILVSKSDYIFNNNYKLFVCMVYLIMVNVSLSYNFKSVTIGFFLNC